MIINIKYEDRKKKIHINNYESILSIKNKFFDNDISLVKNTLFYRNGAILENNDFIERCILSEINFLNTNQKLIQDKNIKLPSFITENKNRFIDFLC